MFYRVTLIKVLAIGNHAFSRILNVLNHHLTEVQAKYECKLNVYIFMTSLAG
jgi:hypothetical protein